MEFFHNCEQENCLLEQSRVVFQLRFLIWIHDTRFDFPNLVTGRSAIDLNVKDQRHLYDFERYIQAKLIAAVGHLNQVDTGSVSGLCVREMTLMIASR